MVMIKYHYSQKTNVVRVIVSNEVHISYSMSIAIEYLDEPCTLTM